MEERGFLEPEWDHKTGLIPPVYPDMEADMYPRSPYRVTPGYLVEYFAGNETRIRLLKLFFDFRARIYRADAGSGFQWVNGSFVEDKERIRGDKPKDIDVVTFLERVPSDNLLADKRAMKRLYSVDPHWVIFSECSNAGLVSRTAYWYSLWGHQRGSFQWKGFLEVPLDEKLDADAIELLSRKENR